LFVICAKHVITVDKFKNYMDQTSEPGQTDEQVYIPPSGQKYVFRFCKWAQLK